MSEDLLTYEGTSGRPDDKITMTRTERGLRELVAYHAGHPMLYQDDGELSDASVHPHIDFLRDSPPEIAHSLQTRSLARWTRKIHMEHLDWSVGAPDCVEACLSGMLGIPLDTIGHFTARAKATHNRHELRTQVWSRADEFLRQQGFHLHTALSKNYVFEGMALAVGSTPEREFHCVILNKGDLWHDPFPGGVGLSEVQQIKLLVPLDPIRKHYHGHTRL